MTEDDLKTEGEAATRREASAVERIVMLNKWLDTAEYLPEILRDFHDRKDLFKVMHYLYQDNESADRVPNWVDGQIYTIDWFLWFMASRGYTLQKSRKNLEFRPIEKFRDLIDKEI